MGLRYGDERPKEMSFPDSSAGGRTELGITLGLAVTFQT